MRPPLTHLLRMTDGVGLHEHARYASPRLEHGYCVDDNARALVVLARDDRDVAAALLTRCLRFVCDAQAPDGTFHNRRGPDQRWIDDAGTGDHWGRALWGLGCLGACHASPYARLAHAAFIRGARHRSPHPRAMAYAALGGATLLDVVEGSDRDLFARLSAQDAADRLRRTRIIAGLLRDAAAIIGAPRAEPAWPWPQPRLTYANARLPEALIAIGTALSNDRVLSDGLDLLGWLVETESDRDIMSFTPVGGWARGEPRPGFDQQPIEAWAMADAAARAWQVTGDTSWASVVDRCAGWFHGRNDSAIPLFDECTGGGCDGLHAAARNENQGAESTLALIATLQVQMQVGAPAE